MNVHPLEGLLAETADLLEGARAVEVGAGGATEWRLDGVAFAACANGVAEFRLRREVAAAALRTPDVATSARGAGWVRFAPALLDEFGTDRARAWFESAWRFADEGWAGTE